MLLFALCHTIGFLLYSPSQPEARHVLELMHSVPLEKPGEVLTFYGFYQGFGLLISAYQVFLAAVAFSISRMLRMGTGVPESLGWSFALVQFITLTLSWLDFSGPPIVMSAVLSIVATGAVLQTRRVGGWSGAGNASSRPAPAG
jgi:hypothetical protein